MKLSLQQKLAIVATVAIPIAGMALVGLTFASAFRVFALGCLCLVFSMCPAFMRDFFQSRESVVGLGWIGYVAIALQVFLPHILEPTQ